MLIDGSCCRGRRASIWRWSSIRLFRLYWERLTRNWGARRSNSIELSYYLALVTLGVYICIREISLFFGILIVKCIWPESVYSNIQMQQNTSMQRSHNSSINYFRFILRHHLTSFDGLLLPSPPLLQNLKHTSLFLPSATIPLNTSTYLMPNNRIPRLNHPPPLPQTIQSPNSISLLSHTDNRRSILTNPQ